MRGAQGRGAAAGVAGRHREGPGAARLRPGPGRRPPSATIARRATASARPARKGYPNLNDDDWLWGGTLEEIKQTITYGVRSRRSPRPTTARCRRSARMGMLKPERDRGGRQLRALIVRAFRPAGRRPRRRQEDLRRQLRRLPRRRRQGQPGARRAEPDRPHLALRLGRGRPSSSPSPTAAAA